MKFPFKAPPNYEYWTDDYSETITRVWIKNKTMEFTFGDEKHPSSVWGFWNKKKKVFLSPINHKKPGKVVDIGNCTPYSAMQLNLNPLMSAFNS